MQRSKARLIAAAGITLAIAGSACSSTAKSERLPTVTTSVGASEDAPEPTTPASTPDTTPDSSPPATSAVSYANCAAVRAAGKAPLYAGQPGYDSDLDRNNNGVACE